MAVWPDRVFWPAWCWPGHRGRSIPAGCTTAATGAAVGGYPGRSPFLHSTMGGATCRRRLRLLFTGPALLVAPDLSERGELSCTLAHGAQTSLGLLCGASSVVTAMAMSERSLGAMRELSGVLGALPGV